MQQHESDVNMERTYHQVVDAGGTKLHVQNTLQSFLFSLPRSPQCDPTSHKPSPKKLHFTVLLTHQQPSTKNPRNLLKTYPNSHQISNSHKATTDSLQPQPTLHKTKRKPQTPNVSHFYSPNHLSYLPKISDPTTI
jgi:hypothetical protein